MLRSIMALGRSLLQSIVILAESLWYEATAFTLVLGISFVSSDTWVVPGLFGAILLAAALLVILLLVNMRLLPVQIALIEKPWGYRRSLLRCIYECIAGCLAAWTGVVAHSIFAGLFRVSSLVSGNYHNVSLIASAAAIFVIIGIPGYRFWRITRRFHLLRVTEKILIRLDERYKEHLRHHLLVSGVSFPVDVTFTPLDVQQHNPSSSDQPAQPVRMDQEEAVAFPALSASLPQPSSKMSPPTPAEVTHEKICQFFDESSRQLLILSGSGGGKSAQLYLLARTLLVEANAMLQGLFQQARNGGRHITLAEMPWLPVILDLSVLDARFGAVPHDHVHKWQREALVKIYGVRSHTAKRWADKGNITSLFDSLDVLDENKRDLCFRRIEKYLMRHKDAPLVVCCSEATYQSSQIYEGYERFQSHWSMDDSLSNAQYGVRLSLPRVTLLPLAPSTVEQALLNAENAGEIRREMQSDPSLAEALRVPMLLSLALAEASRGGLTKPVNPVGGAIDWRGEICRQYVQHILSRTAWPLEQVENTFAWLGYQLWKHQKLVFHLEELQRNWLPSPASQAHYRRQMARVKAFFIIAAGLLFGVAIALTVSLVYSLGDGAAAKATIGSDGGASVGPISRFFFGILGGFGVALGIGTRIDATKDIHLLNHVHPNSDAHRRKLIPVTMLGILVLLTTLCIGGQAVVPRGAVMISVIASVAIGLLIAWCGRLATERDHFPRPNRGFFNATKTSLVIMLIYAFVGLFGGSILVITALNLILGGNLDVRFMISALLVGAGVVALSALIFGGLSAAFRNGGASALRHVVLRRTLRQSRIVPPSFELFLNEARNAGLLRREGDGYSFPLRSAMLRDHLAVEYERRYAAEQQRLTPPRPLYARLGRRLKRASQMFAPKQVARMLRRKGKHKK